MQKRIFSIAGALLLSCCLPVTGFANNVQPFTDVPPTKHFAEAVNDLAERNMIGGYPDGTFKPGNPITRGQAAAIIAKMIHLDMTQVKNPAFKDVSTANSYYKAIAALAEEGIIGGYGDGRFGPNDPIKRGQMASILVKAFDLPREPIYRHPFKDIRNSESHTENILAIYALGITSGTSPTTFSPNGLITRGQTAKMLKATEEAKPVMVTIKASDLNWKYASIEESDAEKGLFKAIQVYGEEGYREDAIQLVPLKEGKGILSLRGVLAADAYAEPYKKYTVHITKVDGELKLKLEEAQHMVPTAVQLFFIEEKIQSISLSTMEGEKLADRHPFTVDEYGIVSFDIDRPGQFIADVKLESGKKIRYGIEAKQKESHFYYDIEAIEEKRSVTFKEDAKHDIRDYTIAPKNATDIVRIIRDPGTNTFHFTATGVKEGDSHIDYGQSFIERPCGESEYCDRFVWSGLQVKVRIIGSIVNVYVYRDYDE